MKGSDGPKASTDAEDAAPSETRGSSRSKSEERSPPSRKSTPAEEDSSSSKEASPSYKAGESSGEDPPSSVAGETPVEERQVVPEVPVRPARTVVQRGEAPAVIDLTDAGPVVSRTRRRSQGGGPRLAVAVNTGTAAHPIEVSHSLLEHLTIC